LGGGTLGHLGLIISDVSYSNIAPPTADAPTFCVAQNAPGRAPSTTDGTADQINAARYVWEEDVQTYRTNTSDQQALKKQIISVFEPMYLDILNENMVGYTNISARDMLDHLFTYGKITAVDLEINFENMRRAWDPSSQWRLSSRRFKTVLTIRRQDASPSVPHIRSTLGMQKYLQQGTL
jgi:hypothetical protein